MSRRGDDDCTYCGTGGAEREVSLHSIFVDEWAPDAAQASGERPAVPACRLCARDVCEVQRRLWLAWSLDAVQPRGEWIEHALEVDPLDVDIMMRRLARALYRWETNELLALDTIIHSLQLSPEYTRDVLNAIATQGLERRELQPGITYWFARAAGRDCESISFVAIGARIFLFAQTLPYRANEGADESKS